MSARPLGWIAPVDLGRAPHAGARTAPPDVRLPPHVTCTQGATVCYQGHPWVCDPSGEYSQADRRCDRLGVVCCLARSPYDAGLRHACVPASACVETAADVDGGVLPVTQ